MTFPIRILADSRAVEGKLVVTINNDPKYELTAAAYEQLHEDLIRGDSVRTTTGEDLIKKDLELLRSDTLPKGFHVVRRNKDATGEYVFSDGKEITPLKIRY